MEFVREQVLKDRDYYEKLQAKDAGKLEIMNWFFDECLEDGKLKSKLEVEDMIKAELLRLRKSLANDLEIKINRDNKRLVQSHGLLMDIARKEGATLYCDRLLLLNEISVREGEE